MGDRFDRLRIMAETLNALSPDPQARVYFELMSGGLVWTDETPVPEEDKPLFPSAGLRGIWNYRTSLIEGKPNEKFAEWWSVALQLFPNWPGFLPERRDPSLRDLLEREREVTGDPFEKLDQLWQAQQAARAANAVNAE